MAPGRVLLIGGAGFIGQHAARHLVALGWQVHATHAPGKTPPSIGGVDWLPTDLTSAQPAHSWPTKCDAVIYLAQSRNWRVFPDQAEDVFAINVAGLMQSILYARKAGATRFVYTSSGSIYTQSRQATVETEPLELDLLKNFYPATKLIGELLLRPFQSYFSTQIHRIYMPYGSGQNPNMLLPRLLRSVRHGTPIQLQGNDGLSANPVAVADVAEALARGLDLEGPRVWNVAGPNVLTLRAMGEHLGRAVGREPVFEVQSTATPPVIAGETSALQAALGWSPARTLAQGLRCWLDEEAATSQRAA